MKGLNKKGADSRAISILIFIPLLFIAAILINNYFNDNIEGRETRVIKADSEIIDFDKILVSFLDQHGNLLLTGNEDAIDVLLRQEFEPKYRVLKLGEKINSCKAKKDKIECLALVTTVQKPRNIELRKYFQKAYIARPNGEIMPIEFTVSVIA